MTIARGSEDAVQRAEGMDVQGILEREFKSVWDLGKIPGLKKAFSNNVQQVRRAPDMVRDFYSQAKKIILEIYRAFSDEEEQKKIEGELNEGDSTSKEKDRNEGNEAEGANGGSIKVKLRKLSPTRKRTKRSFIRSWSLIQWVLMTLKTCSLPLQLPLIRSWKPVRVCKQPKNLSRILLRRSLT